MKLETKLDVFRSIKGIEEDIKKRKGDIIHKNPAFSTPSCGEECKDVIWRLTSSCESSGITTEFYSCEGCSHPATISFNIKYNV